MPLPIVPGGATLTPDITVSGASSTADVGGAVYPPIWSILGASSTAGVGGVFFPHVLWVLGVPSTPTVAGAFIVANRGGIIARGIASGPIVRGPSFTWSYPTLDPLPTIPPDPTATFSPALTLDLVEPPIDTTGTFDFDPVVDFAIVVANVQGRVKLDWVDTFSDVGSGNVEVLRKISDGAGHLIDNPTTAVWNPDRCLTAKLYGRPCITLMRGPLVDTVISPQEESTETITVSNAPSTAYKLNDTILRPPNDLLQFPIQEVMHYDWPSMWVFSEHYAPNVKDFYRWFDLPFAVRSAPQLNTHDAFFYSPAGWPDPNAQWIWDRSWGFPAGTCYFYSLLDPPEGQYQLWTSGLGPYEVWMDGVKVAEETGPFTGQCAKTDVYIQTGYTYRRASPTGTLLSIKATSTNPNGTGFMYCLFPMNADGSLAYASHARSDTHVRVASYPPNPPGMTAGNIILSILCGAIDTQGQFCRWKVTFTGSTDSNGLPWPILYGRTFPTGTTVLEALRQLADADIDWSVHPTSYTLDAYIKPGIYGPSGSQPISDEGTMTGVTLTSSYGGGNMTHLANSWEQG